MKKTRFLPDWEVQIKVNGEWRTNKVFRYYAWARKNLEACLSLNIEARIKHPCGDMAFGCK